jgi:hypothetical protein
MARSLTASDRTSLIRLASSLPVGSPERKAILAGLNSISGSVKRTDISGDYGNRLVVRFDGNVVEFVVTTWGRIGGIDSLYGADKPEIVLKETSRPDPKLVLSKVKSILKNPDMLWLNSVKQSDFRWSTPYGKVLKGLNLNIVTAFLDSFVLPENLWNATYDKPRVKPVGGPFMFDSSTTMKEVAEQLRTQGHPLVRTRAVPTNFSKSHALELQNGRMYKQLLALLEASADSMSKVINDQGWEEYAFRFGDKKVLVGKINFGYPVNGVKWAVWTNPK